MMTSINTVYNIAACAANDGNQNEINKAVSPRGLLEYIVNFFTFGCVRKNNEKLYHQIKGDILRSICSPEILFDFTKTGVITLDNIQGNKVTFTLPGSNNANGMVLLTVSNGKYEEEGEIPGVNFNYLLTAMRRTSGENALNSIEVYNEDETGLSLGYHYIDDTFDDYSSIFKTRYASADSAIGEAPNVLDVEDINSIIQEGGIFSISSRDTSVHPS